MCIRDSPYRQRVEHLVRQFVSLGRRVVHISSVSYTHLDVYKRQIHVSRSRWSLASLYPFTGRMPVWRSGPIAENSSIAIRLRESPEMACAGARHVRQRTVPKLETGYSCAVLNQGYRAWKGTNNHDLCLLYTSRCV